MDNIGQLGIGIATLAIVLVVVFLIIAQGKDQIGTVEGLDNVTGENNNCSASAACNATQTLQGAIETIPDWVPLIVIAVIGSILLGLVALFRRSGR